MGFPLPSFSFTTKYGLLTLCAKDLRTFFKLAVSAGGGSNSANVGRCVMAYWQKDRNFPQRRGSITQFSPTLRSLRCSLHSHRGHVPGAQYFSAQRSYHVTRDKRMDFTGAIRKLLRRPNHYRNTQNTGDRELLKVVLYDTNLKHARRGMCADGTAIALRRSVSTINVSINIYHDP